MRNQYIRSIKTDFCRNNLKCNIFCTTRSAKPNPNQSIIFWNILYFVQQVRLCRTSQTSPNAYIFWITVQMDGKCCMRRKERRPQFVTCSDGAGPGAYGLSAQPKSARELASIRRFASCPETCCAWCGACWGKQTPVSGPAPTTGGSTARRKRRRSDAVFLL